MKARSVVIVGAVALAGFVLGRIGMKLFINLLVGGVLF